MPQYAPAVAIVTDGVTTINPAGKITFPSGSVSRGTSGGEAVVAFGAGTSVTMIGSGGGTVAAVSKVTFDAATVSGTAGNTTVTISGGLPADGLKGQLLTNVSDGVAGWSNDITASPTTNFQIIAGDSVDESGAGNFFAAGGNDTGTGGGAGSAGITGGQSNSDGVPGGGSSIQGGAALVGNANGGAVTIVLGIGNGSGRSGQLVVNNATDVHSNKLGTLTNAPVAGDPALFLEVVMDGITYGVPAWAIA